ncbi:MAG: protein translocase subunit SecF [Rhodobacterales bacterium]|jgi:preprotein translocase subunit SecF|nr:protein translocase subunit SecF [Pseudomonadota bacterium]MDA1286451.1 protein translocase subunit SecF [Pseudomonadota bacterium]NQW14391.1 protein translocase subunit SecF [Rhodobacter sp.]
MKLNAFLPGQDSPALPFSKWRFIGFGVITLLLLITLVSLGWRGLNLGLDLTGGLMVEVHSTETIETASLRQSLAANGVEDASIQLSDGGQTAFVRVGLAENQNGDTMLTAIHASFDKSMTVRSEEIVGSKVSSEMYKNGLIACILAVTAIAIYVWLRFEAKFGLAAFLTTLHDILMLFGLYSVTGLSFDLTSIAAILAIAGYSINDTVVVFDRIRERLGRDQQASVEQVIDRSITDTLRRTLMTSSTTLITTVALMIFGGPIMFGFAAAVSFGIIIGTYSSIFVAAPLLIHLPGRMPGRLPPEAMPV